MIHRLEEDLPRERLARISDVEPVSLNLNRVDGVSFDGALNRNELMVDDTGRRYIRRTPLEYDEGTLGKIDRELTATFGGDYRYRTPAEQASFMRMAASYGINAVTPAYINRDHMLVPFVEGEQLADYLQRGKMQATEYALFNLALAKAHNLPMGDRWTRNTIVVGEKQAVEIDFDIELLGEYGCEYDLAQTLYHVVHFSKNRESMLEYLAGIVSTQPDMLYQYDIVRVIGFLDNFATFFGDQEYEGIPGGIEREVEELVEVLQTINF